MANKLDSPSFVLTGIVPEIGLVEIAMKALMSNMMSTYSMMRGSWERGIQRTSQAAVTYMTKHSRAKGMKPR